MMTTLKWFSLITLLFCFGCSQSDQSRSIRNKDEILIEESGFFRGYKLGWSTDSVLTKESWTPVLSNDSVIEYHQSVIIMEDSLPLDAYLAFDELGLFEVQVDVFTDGDSLSKGIIETWSKKLTESFGEPEDLVTARRWTTMSASNNLVEITLSLDRTPQSEPFISLNYLETLDDEY
jgi:hypothetical protein